MVFLERMPNGYLRTTGWSQGRYTVDPKGLVHGDKLAGTELVSGKSGRGVAFHRRDDSGGIKGAGYGACAKRSSDRSETVKTMRRSLALIFLAGLRLLRLCPDHHRRNSFPAAVARG